MTHKLLQITHNFSQRSPAEFVEQTMPLAPYIAEVPGLLWKLWMLNQDECTFSGLYLFEDEAAARAYLAGSIADMVRNDTTNTNIHTALYDLMERPSALTHFPLPVS